MERRCSYAYMDVIRDDHRERSQREVGGGDSRLKLLTPQRGKKTESGNEKPEGKIYRSRVKRGGERGPETTKRRGNVPEKRKEGGERGEKEERKKREEEREREKRKTGGKNMPE